ncbi:hypothetical protein O0I10_011764 [Lichtheimia ornata]|uniref:Uncharacterized protein n=1 Tax=Lichtheimia ornata TaxID=688661 RepID=A0AAD7UT11_9FUNG|nr:uncharacterized protein O0I10_011764 [Lichtheimia ornata]KAJ8652618.1 hypothetical protein O0I10_011764 [Lichtheimia ornata]
MTTSTLSVASTQLCGWWIPYHAPSMECVDVDNNSLKRSATLLEALCSMASTMTSLALNPDQGDVEPVFQLIQAMGRHACVQQLVLASGAFVRDYFEMKIMTIVMKPMTIMIGKLRLLKRLSLRQGMMAFRCKPFIDTILHLATHCCHLCEMDIQAHVQDLDTGALVLSTLDQLESIGLHVVVGFCCYQVNGNVMWQLRPGKIL